MARVQEEKKTENLPLETIEVEINIKLLNDKLNYIINSLEEIKMMVRKD